MRHVLQPALAFALLLVLVAAHPVAAKEGLDARLDAPIAFGTPPGTEILVGVTVEVLTDEGPMPVDGSPIQLLVTGRDGTVVRAAGAADGKPGHYTMRVVIPPGGVRGAEVVMHGTSDLPLRLTEDPFTFGPVRAGTAQVAPPLEPPITPWPRVSAAPAADPAGGLATTAGTPEAGSAPDPGVAWPVAAGLGALVLLVIGVVAAIGRRARASRAGTADAAGRASGA